MCYSLPKRGSPDWTILFKKCTAEILVIAYIPTQYTNKSETILRAKLINVLICEEMMCFTPQLMCCIAREYSLREDYNLIGSRKNSV